MDHTECPIHGPPSSRPRQAGTVKRPTNTPSTGSAMTTRYHQTADLPFASITMLISRITPPDGGSVTSSTNGREQSRASISSRGGSRQQIHTTTSSLLHRDLTRRYADVRLREHWKVTTMDVCSHPAVTRRSIPTSQVAVHRTELILASIAHDTLPPDVTEDEAQLIHMLRTWRDEL